MADSWRNRITETRIVTASELAQNSSNFRRHPTAQSSAVRGLLNEVGIVAPLIAYVSERAGGALTLIDGHMRQEIGGEWPVTILNVTDAEADLILASLDYTTSLAELDAAALADLLGRVALTPVEDEGVQALLAQLAAEHVPEPVKTDVDAEPQVDRAAELQQVWQTATGQLWQLGEHRLICGDCTDASVVARLMGGERAVLMVTDPPYGIEHDTSWREEAGISSMGEQSAKGIEWDSNDNWATAYALSGAAVAFVWHASSHNIVVALSLVEAGYEVKQMIIWNKNVAPFGRSHYSYKHEPCWYAVKKGKTANWHGPNNEVTVWDTASPRHIMGGSTEEKTPHPTQKPIMLYERPITNHTQVGDVVYEPFCGSGTSIIACEQLGRRCRAIEISPAYVAVALQRYFDATSKQPVLLEAALPNA